MPMNEIDLPTMTPAERELLIALEHPKRRRNVVTWWLPLLIVFLIFAAVAAFSRQIDTREHHSPACSEYRHDSMGTECVGWHWSRR